MQVDFWMIMCFAFAVFISTWLNYRWGFKKGSEFTLIILEKGKIIRIHDNKILPGTLK